MSPPNVVCWPGASSHRKCTRRPGRKAPTLRPDPNTSVTAGVRVVRYKMFFSISIHMEIGMGLVCFLHASLSHQVTSLSWSVFQLNCIKYKMTEKKSGHLYKWFQIMLAVLWYRCTYKPGSRPYTSNVTSTSIMLATGLSTATLLISITNSN